MAVNQLLPFGEQLRLYRRDRGLTQEELAEQAGLSARGIRALEQGERNSPQKTTVGLLAEALQLTPVQRLAFERAAASAGPSEPAQKGSGPPIGGFLGAVPAGPTIARQHEIDRLLAALDEVTGGAGRLVMLVGEPGVGKTRLAQEATVAARTHGCLVASGRCYEPEQSTPYYPFLEALTALYEGAPAGTRASVPERWPYLEWLLPDRPHAVDASEVSGQDAQQRLFWAVSGFLQAVAEATPVALLLDDLHWADETSLKLLQHIARQARGSSVLLLGTYRDIELGRQHPLDRTLRDLRREGLIDEIPVRRLDQSGTAALAAILLGEARVSPEFAELVHERTEGNPFFTQEVIHGLVERGDVLYSDGRWDRRALNEIEVPRSVRSAIGERVSRLSEQTQEILHEASVLGQAFAFDDLQTLSKRSEEEVEKALEEALTVTLIRVTGKDGYAFNHALTQQTLYAELSPRRRNRFHAAVGEALAQLPETSRRRRAAQIAWHFLQADSAERALPFVMLAGDAAEAVFAHHEAEQHYRTALDLARELDDRDREAEALEKLGTVLRLVVRYEEALEVLERAATLWAGAGDLEGEARATYEIGFVHYYRGTPDQGLERVQAITDRSDRTSLASRAHANLYTALGFDLWPLARYSESLAATERAAEIARSGGHAGAEALAEALRGHALTMIRPLAVAHQGLENAAQLCAASGDSWWMGQAIAGTGRAYLDEGHFGKGRDHLERSRALFEAVQEQAEMVWIESNLGEASYLMGDWAAARARYEGVVQTARQSNIVRYLSYALLHLAELSAAEGRWEEAECSIAEGLETGQEHRAVPALRKGQRLLAEHDLMEGRADRVVERLSPWLASSEHDWPRAFPPPVLAEAYLRLGEAARAEALVLQRIERFRAQNHRRALALWLPVQGMVLAHQHRWEEADRVLAEAVSLARDMGYQQAEGRALYEHGRLHLECGRHEQARSGLEEALAIFRRLGARPDAERIAQVLHDLG